MCTACRDSSIRLAIPRWIVVVGFGIGALAIMSMVLGGYQLPTTMALVRARAAMDRHEYATAHGALRNFLSTHPDHTEGNVRMIIAAAHTFEMQDLMAAVKVMDGRAVPDDALLRDANIATEQVGYYIPSEGPTTDSIKRYFDDVQSLISLEESLPFEDTALSYRLDILDRLHDLSAYDHVVRRIATLDEYANTGDCRRLTMIKASSLCNLERYDDASVLCDVLLAINREDARAMAMKAWIAIGKGDPGTAGTLIQRAHSLAPGSQIVTEARVHIACRQRSFDQAKAIHAVVREGERGIGADDTMSRRLAAIIASYETTL